MDSKYLFRGKRLDNGEWVEGYYAKTTPGQAYILPKSLYINFEHQTIAIGGFVEVDPSTVDCCDSTQSLLSPCDLCRYDPPSSLGGKPCSICPATPKEDCHER